MKDDRLRVIADDPFVSALGRAAYVFAVLEWNAVWCCERIQTGYINSLARKTAGMIAGDLVRLATEHLDEAVRHELTDAAQEFKRLVDIRNGILHGKPGTAPEGSQRLFRDGIPWTRETIADAADAFAACSIVLNAILYNHLSVQDDAARPG